MQPSSTVAHIHAMVLARLPACKAWCATVKVTPEVSNKAVLMVGNQNGPTVSNGSTVPAGDAVAPCTTLGQAALKSGHSKLFSKFPSSGTECARAHHKAVKKAPKNMTSEKMNQLMLQR